MLLIVGVGLLLICGMASGVHSNKVAAQEEQNAILREALLEKQGGGVNSAEIEALEQRVKELENKVSLLRLEVKSIPRH